jgi:hypothetical protein
MYQRYTDTYLVLLDVAPKHMSGQMVGVRHSISSCYRVYLKPTLSIAIHAAHRLTSKEVKVSQ